MDMEELDQQIDRPSKRLAILYSVFIAVPIYGILVGAYYLDFLNGFAFLGALIVAMVIALIFLIIFRKNKFKSLTVILVLLLLFLFLGYEIRLLRLRKSYLHCKWL